MTLTAACTPIKPTITNQYKISAFSSKRLDTSISNKSILVSQPEAVSGYQTEQMLYIDKPFQLSAFAHSSWIGPPATMLTPLIVQSLQNSHFFHGVASGPNSDKTDYRLDTQLFALQQNFIKKPSVIELTVQAVLTRVSENQVIGSRTFVERVVCPSDTPYGGVVAANKAARALTAQLSNYAVQQVKQDIPA